MQALTIDLDHLQQALDSYASDHYLDLESGEIRAITPGEPLPGSDEKYAVQPDRYLHIEPLGQAQALAMRAEFLFAQPHPHAHPILIAALEGRRPLRTFDYKLEDFPEVRNAWHAYRLARLREYALAWLEENDLESLGH
ncbi:UPF0158 family protein [Azomonas macrocytogenes]|uniref:Uncharacterized protein n=1 Tax=Azomonas macrocytogenes TaxID=69962 RepID=A0A839SZY5_AZOMA|nr:UPF0158 family protein [Azomonas macrocytogenes]MBB3102881.1 hypothetical protein [Azomonas macrocytogenes]